MSVPLEFFEVFVEQLAPRFDDGHRAAAHELLQPYGVPQFVRSGIVAIIKSRRELLNEYLEELERSRRQTNSNHF